MSENTPEKEWLGLGETAKYLGVHPITLRRWADAGEINYMLTAGGHRRFAVNEVKRFMSRRQRQIGAPRTEQVWADQAMERSQQVVRAHRNARWMEAFGEEDRERSRLLGRRLMATVLQYVSSNDNAEVLIDEARSVGREYARSAIAHGLPLATVLEATMSFRDAMFEAAILAPEVTHSSTQKSAHLLKKINTLLNAVQLAVAAAYDESNP
ncbi:MAG: helix-turn-helix domain-containing protein [Chloroflexi bacterium]|nr:helix-turn-helix domain-containing protein [Chloroflexota bacterium]